MFIRSHVLSLFVFSAFTLVAHAQDMPGTLSKCLSAAKTQYESNQCAGRDYQQADRELNETYQAVIKKMSIDGGKKGALFVQKFRAAQRAWLKWRDAEMQAIYPAKDKQDAYGSIFPLCAAERMAEMTRERTKQLRQWLDGAEEGDVCSGSIPVH